MGEYITKSQSQRRCHCYGPVRAPALWFLGGSYREDFGGGPSGTAPRPAALVSGLVPSLHISARGSRRRARVLVGAAAALGPGPSHSLLLRRGLGGAARCSRRALPLRIPPLTGTSPLSPQQTRKVRLSPVSRPGGRRADAAVSFWGRGGCGPVGTGKKLTHGGLEPSAPAGPSQRPEWPRVGCGELSKWLSQLLVFATPSGGRFFWRTYPPRGHPRDPKILFLKWLGIAQKGMVRLAGLGVKEWERGTRACCFVIYQHITFCWD